jgi:hypothetical protein
MVVIDDTENALFGDLTSQILFSKLLGSSPHRLGLCIVFGFRNKNLIFITLLIDRYVG